MRASRAALWPPRSRRRCPAPLRRPRAPPQPLSRLRTAQGVEIGSPERQLVSSHLHVLDTELAFFQAVPDPARGKGAAASSRMQSLWDEYVHGG